MYSTLSSAIHVDNEHAYIMTSTFDTTRIAVLKGKLYKINLTNSTIEDSIIINTNPIEFETISNRFYVTNDTLHYLAFGSEWRDTIINGQNNFKHYHHFKLNLADGSWANNTFPAVDHTGLQFLIHRNAVFTDSEIYLSNISRDTATNETDVIITKLDHHGNIIWNTNYSNDTNQSIWSILEDRKGDIVFCGTFFGLARDRRSGFSHLYVQKISPDDGHIIKVFSLEENVEQPRAMIEDPNGGYIIGVGEAEFREGGRYPAIPRIIKVDENLDSIIWELPLSDSLSFNIFWHLDKFIYLGNNEFLGVGISDFSSSHGHLGRVVKFTSDGDLIFDKEIYNTEPNVRLEQRLIDVVPYKNGFVACGTLFASSLEVLAPRQQGWVVYFDENGNTDFSSSTANIAAAERNRINVFPNPNQGQFTVELRDVLEEDSKWHIYSLEGKLIQSGTLLKGNSKLPINLSNAQSGNYIVQIVSKNFIGSKIIYVDN